MALITYNSFEQIDQRLKILKLQREIHKESIKFCLNNTKTNFYPKGLLCVISGFMQKIAEVLIALKGVLNSS